MAIELRDPSGGISLTSGGAPVNVSGAPAPGAFVGVDGTSVAEPVANAIVATGSLLARDATVRAPVIVAGLIATGAFLARDGLGSTGALVTAPGTPAAATWSALGGTGAVSVTVSGLVAAGAFTGLDGVGALAVSASGGFAAGSFSGVTATISTAAMKIEAALIEVEAGEVNGTYLYAVLLEVEAIASPDNIKIGSVLTTTEVSGESGIRLWRSLVEAEVPRDTRGISLFASLIEAEVGGAIVVAQPATPSAFAAGSDRVFGRDLVLTWAETKVRPTITGDWPIISGRPNLQAAMIRRALTSRTTLVHRPEYGGDLQLQIEAPGSPARLAEAANRIRDNARLDPRVGNARAVASQTAIGEILVDLVISPKGQQEPETFTLTVLGQ